MRCRMMCLLYVLYIFQAGIQYQLPPKKVEDNHSETSGDTGTSDSGQGGSDEEIHNSFSYTHRERPPGIKNIKLYIL